MRFSSPYFWRKCWPSSGMSSFRSRRGGSSNRDDVQPVEEILAELAVLHHLPQVEVRGRDDADVDLDRLHAAEAHEVALLDDAQQLGLGLERHVADLVEEDRAAVREVEQPLLRVDGAREGALHVAEERRFEEVRGQVAGVDGDEGPLGSGRVRVDGAGHQLLARAALALNQDRRPARGGLDDQVEHLPHPGAAPDDVGELVVPLLDVLPERAVLAQQVAPLEGVADDDEHLVVLERLRDVVERSALHRGNRALDRRVRGDDDDGQLLVDVAQLVQRGDAVQSRHHDVHDGGVERQRPGELEPLGPGGRNPHVIAFAGEQRLEDLPHDLFVVDDQNRAA